MNKKLLKEMMSNLGKLSHKKSPRSKHDLKRWSKKGVAARRAKLSTDGVDPTVG